MINKPLFCLLVLCLLGSALADINARSYKSAVGVVVETGNLVTIQQMSGRFPYLTFDADIPRFEMTTGLFYAGDISIGQTVCLVYKSDPENGLVQAEYLLFNPGHPMAADIETRLFSYDNELFYSDNGSYLLCTDSNTDITDAYGRKTELRSGQFILGWIRENTLKRPKQALLHKAVVLNITDDDQTDKQITITNKGEVLLDDGPIAQLDNVQAEFSLQCQMAPVRPIAEALGYTVEWGPNQTVCIKNDETIISFKIGDDFYQVNNKFRNTNGKCFTIFNDSAFADYAVINALIKNRF